jgi:hypothetical protein
VITRKEPWIYGGECLISQSKDDDARTLGPGGRENISEIQIERDDSAEELANGAIVIVEDEGFRLRRLPIRP